MVDADPEAIYGPILLSAPIIAMRLKDFRRGEFVEPNDQGPDHLRRVLHADAMARDVLVKQLFEAALGVALQSKSV
jgi:hypothetical protein